MFFQTTEGVFGGRMPHRRTSRQQVTAGRQENAASGVMVFASCYGNNQHLVLHTMTLFDNSNGGIVLRTRKVMQRSRRRIPRKAS